MRALAVHAPSRSVRLPMRPPHDASAAGAGAFIGNEQRMAVSDQLVGDEPVCYE